MSNTLKKFSATVAGGGIGAAAVAGGLYAAGASTAAVATSGIIGVMGAGINSLIGTIGTFMLGTSALAPFIGAVLLGCGMGLAIVLCAGTGLRMAQMAIKKRKAESLLIKEEMKEEKSLHAENAKGNSQKVSQKITAPQDVEYSANKQKEQSI